MFDSFYETISQKVDKYIPIKVMSKKKLKIQSKPDGLRLLLEHPSTQKINFTKNF
jgi:hypothetical protein